MLQACRGNGAAHSGDAIERFFNACVAARGKRQLYQRRLFSTVAGPFCEDQTRTPHGLKEAAVAAGCAAIVTFNLKDFGGVEQFNLQVWTPAQFLEQLELR